MPLLPYPLASTGDQAVAWNRSQKFMQSLRPQVVAGQKTIHGPFGQAVMPGTSLAGGGGSGVMEACFAFKCMSSNSEDCIQAYAFDPTKIGASPIDFSQVFDIALPFDLRPSYHTSGEVIDGVTDSSGATYTYTIASQKRKCTFTDSFGNARTEYQFITPLYIVATQSATPPYTTGTFFWAKNMGKSVGPTWGTGGSLTTQWQCCHEGKEWAWDPAITS